MTECKPQQLEFHGLGNREVVAQFNGGDITSDAGGLVLREVEQRTGIIRKFATCFTDYRNPELIEHPVEDLLTQRLYGICLGYVDLNDHDQSGKKHSAGADFFEELTFCSGPQAERLRESWVRTISRIEHLILAAEQRGHIRCDEDPSFVAHFLLLPGRHALVDRWS